MDTVDLLALATPVTYFAFLLTEKLWLAREFPPRRGWQWIGAAFLVLIGTVSTVVPLLIPESWLATHRVFNGTRLGVLAGTIVGFVVAEGAIYLYHRLSHRVNFMWRGFHQVHHSPRRVDIPGSVVFHPLEMINQTFILLFVT